METTQSLTHKPLFENNAKKQIVVKAHKKNCHQDRLFATTSTTTSTSAGLITTVRFCSLRRYRHLYKPVV